MSTNPSEKATLTDIADIQGGPDTRRLAINKVGIKEIRHPMVIRQRDGGEQHTVATISMYVDLPHHFKGTHMSRFVAILNEHEKELTVASFREMLVEVTERLEAERGHVDLAFPYFVNKRAPVSGVESLMDYRVAFLGEREGSQNRITVTVTVPVTSLCPCSKAISDYGAHNQRSEVTLAVRLGGFMWIEELIDIVESEASCEVYGLLKRPDEKHVTERAYDNPKFVEDMTRDIAARLVEDERVEWFRVESENFESIHNHSAYAMIERERESE